jgi:ribonuclease R
VKTISGILRLTQHGYGFVDLEEDASVFIAKSEAQKAFDGDLVKVEVHDRGHAAGPEGHILSIQSERRPPLLGRIFRSSGQWLAEIKSGPTCFTAQIQHFPKTVKPKTDHWALFRSSEGRQRWPLPVCHLEKLLGDPRHKPVAEKGLLISHGFSEAYPQKAVKESAALKMERTRPGSRRDLRNQFVVTIDPADAKDHDDAVALTRDSQGRYHLSVHIADVSRYVPEASAIDEEARKRAFSVYLLHHHLPMLPPRLPGELCSLKPGKDRLALSVLMLFDSTGQILQRQLLASRIQVRRLISYEQAQEHLDAKTKGSDPELHGALKSMWELASKLRERRLAEGGVDFDLPEPGFHWDGGAAPSRIFREERLQSHQLIEEFMLAANRAIAEIWADKFGDDVAFIHRVHPPLDATKREKLAEYLRDAGFDWPTEKLTTARQIAELIDQARRRFPQEVVSVIARKALTLARYDAQALGHFGLGFKRYVHFTSPIRRYADLMVHRLLWKHIIGAEKVKNDEELQSDLGELCNHLSQRERIIAELERESSKLAGLLYLDQRSEEVFSARLVEVYREKFFVSLENLYIEGVLDERSDVHFRPRDTNRPERKRHRQEQTGVAIGDRLDVEISRLDLLNRKLELKPL